MSFHAGQTFTFGETPSATKWNYLWENDYALQDWSAYTADTFPLTLIANRTKRHQMQLQADGSGGAVQDQNEGPAVAFTGTPSGFARATGIVPADYAGGDITIKCYWRSSTTNSSETVRHYVACRSIGDVHSSWNIGSNVDQTVSFSTTWSLQTLSTTIPDASVDANDIIAVAVGPITALSGTVYLAAVVMEYTADH